MIDRTPADPGQQKHTQKHRFTGNLKLFVLDLTMLFVFIFKYVQMWLKETLMEIVEIWPFKVWWCWIRV